MKPMVLDVYCGAGGCTKGYQRAGFYVVGVDIHPQIHYCGDEFIQDDALHFLDTADLSRFAVFHASPPCQHFTHMLNHGMTDRGKHPDLIDATRQRFNATRKPYVLENVPGARRKLVHPLLLCGNMFGLRVYRHRLFEISSKTFVFGHPHVKHREKIVHAGIAPRQNEFYCPVGHLADQAGSQRAMGIDWMQGQYEIAQAIPPAYTEWIGRQLFREVQG